MYTKKHIGQEFNIILKNLKRPQNVKIHLKVFCCMVIQRRLKLSLVYLFIDVSESIELCGI